MEQQEPRCLERVWRSYKFDSLVQAADINLLTLGKEDVIAIKEGWEEKQMGKKENKELWFYSTKRLVLVLESDRLASPYISVSNF